MARGGMSNRGGPTLAERSASRQGLHAGGADPGGPPPAEPTSEGQGSRQRHCWVHTPEAPSEPRPGLVIEWQRSATKWQARVVYTLDDGDKATTVETWVEAERLRPA